MKKSTKGALVKIMSIVTAVGSSALFCGCKNQKTGVQNDENKDNKEVIINDDDPQVTPVIPMKPTAPDEPAPCVYGPPPE